MVVHVLLVSHTLLSYHGMFILYLSIDICIEVVYHIICLFVDINVYIFLDLQYSMKGPI